MPVLSLACHLPHNTPNIPSRYNNEQTTKQTKAINNSYIYIYISCKCDTNRAGHFTFDAYASRPVACPWSVLPFPFDLCLSEMLVKRDRVRLGCHSWPVWEELVPSEPANERPVTNHIHDCHMMNIQSIMANTKNSHRSTAPSFYQTHHSFYKIFQYFELIPVNQSPS